MSIFSQIVQRPERQGAGAAFMEAAAKAKAAKAAAAQQKIKNAFEQKKLEYEAKKIQNETLKINNENAIAEEKNRLTSIQNDDNRFKTNLDLFSNIEKIQDTGVRNSMGQMLIDNLVKNKNLTSKNASKYMAALPNQEQYIKNKLISEGISTKDAGMLDMAGMADLAQSVRDEKDENIKRTMNAEIDKAGKIGDAKLLRDKLLVKENYLYESNLAKLKGSLDRSLQNVKDSGKIKQLTAEYLQKRKLAQQEHTNNLRLLDTTNIYKLSEIAAMGRNALDVATVKEQGMDRRQATGFVFDSELRALENTLAKDLYQTKSAEERAQIKLRHANQIDQIKMEYGLKLNNARVLGDEEAIRQAVRDERLAMYDMDKIDKRAGYDMLKQANQFTQEDIMFGREAAQEADMIDKTYGYKQLLQQNDLATKKSTAGTKKANTKESKLKNFSSFPAAVASISNIESPADYNTWRSSVATGLVPNLQTTVKALDGKINILSKARRTLETNLKKLTRKNNIADALKSAEYRYPSRVDEYQNLEKSISKAEYSKLISNAQLENATSTVKVIDTLKNSAFKKELNSYLDKKSDLSEFGKEAIAKQAIVSAIGTKFSKDETIQSMVNSEGFINSIYEILRKSGSL